MKTKTNQATQVIHPWRASLRTSLQTLIPTAALLIIVVPQVIESIIEETSAHGFTLSPTVYALLTGTSAVIALIAGIIARVSAIPGIEDLLEKHLPFLAAEPLPQEARYHDDGEGEILYEGSSGFTLKSRE